MNSNYGITGDIASGKSTLSRMLIDMGFMVLDADLVSREVMEPGQRGYELVRENYPQAFDNDLLNRKKLADIIFTDPEERRRLDSLLHPLILEIMFDRARGNLAFHDAPLLFESGMDKHLKKVIYLAVDEDIQLERIMARDGLTRQEALKRMGSFDYPREEKLKRSYVIDNNGSIEELRRKLEIFLRQEGLV